MLCMVRVEKTSLSFQFKIHRMDQIKQLANAVDQATSDMLTQPTLTLYNNVEKILSSRADMSKHLISYASKRLMIKNKKVLFLMMDLLEYLSYQTELSFYSQVATKDFLLRISGLLQSKDLDPAVLNKVLCVVRCWEELFRPHQDLLPMFFQFYDGLQKKGYENKSDYVSPYRPKELKKYPSKPNPAEQRKQPAPAQRLSEPTTVAMDPQSLSSVREQISLTNEVIDGCDPAEGVATNPLLGDLMTGLKEAEKKLIKIINEATNEKLVEEAIALNDDLIVTFRRYKDLQKNKKPEPFLKTELASNFIATEGKSSPPQPKTNVQQGQPKPGGSLFDEFGMQEKKAPKQLPKPPQPVANLMDLDFEAPKPVAQPVRPAVQPPSGANLFDIMDMNPNPVPMNTMTIQMQPAMNTNAYNLMGPQPVAPISINTGAMNTGLNTGINQINFGGPGPNQPMPPAPIGGLDLLGGPVPLATGPQIGNLNAVPSEGNFATEADFKPYHKQSDLTDLSDWFSKKN